MPKYCKTQKSLFQGLPASLQQVCGASASSKHPRNRLAEPSESLSHPGNELAGKLESLPHPCDRFAGKKYEHQNYLNSLVQSLHRSIIYVGHNFIDKSAVRRTAICVL